MFVCLLSLSLSLSLSTSTCISFFCALWCSIKTIVHVHACTYTTVYVRVFESNIMMYMYMYMYVRTLKLLNFGWTILLEPFLSHTRVYLRRQLSSRLEGDVGSGARCRGMALSQRRGGLQLRGEVGGSSCGRRGGEGIEVNGRRISPSSAAPRVGLGGWGRGGNTPRGGVRG